MNNEQWEDVTGACFLESTMHRILHTCPDGEYQVTAGNGYRIRKVPVIMQNDQKHDGDAFDTTVRMAFVVERKVSE